jgi:hypothetical protein
MKRAGFTLVCCLALTGTARAAQPMDFEMAGPAAIAANSGGYRSPVLRAAHRFDLVGMRWANGVKPEISLRARKAGGRWTKWTRVPTDTDDSPDKGAAEASPRGFSAPVWTGDADFVQYHVTRPVAGLRLHFVSIPPSTRKALASRKTANDTGTGMPVIQPRSAWGAQDCVPRGQPSYGDVQAALIHHTVSANDYTAAEVPSIILSICRYHRNSNGWNDIGYNFLVDQFGTLWEGRAGGMDQAIVGAQAQGYNSHTTGIADIGEHQDLPETSVALDAIARLIRWKLPLHGVPTQGTVTLTSGGGSLNRYPAGTAVTLDRISGHRDGDNTACPGNALYAQLPDLRARVGDVQPLQPVQVRTQVEVSLTPAAIVYPAQATLIGALRQITGEPVAGAPLAVEALGTSGWRTAWRATSGDDGGFRIELGARLSHQVRVRFGGDTARIGATSAPLQLNVVPELKLQRSQSRRAVGQTVTLTGTVQPNKARLTLVVERRDGKTTSRGVLKIGTTGGRFSRTYTFHSPGLFRFYVAFAGDKGNAPAKSAAVYVRATGSGVPAANTPTGGGVSPSGGAAAGAAVK